MIVIKNHYLFDWALDMQKSFSYAELSVILISLFGRRSNLLPNCIGVFFMTVTKVRLASAVQKRLGFSRKNSSLLIDSFFETIKKTLTSGENICISRFGKFSVKEVGSGKNPKQSNSDVLNREITFKCSPVLSKKMNGE